jgi:hypothetical protein
MAETDRRAVWMAVVGTAASVAVAALLWMIVMHPVAVAQLLAAGR